MMFSLTNIARLIFSRDSLRARLRLATETLSDMGSPICSAEIAQLKFVAENQSYNLTFQPVSRTLQDAQHEASHIIADAVEGTEGDEMAALNAESILFPENVADVKFWKKRDKETSHQIEERCSVIDGMCRSIFGVSINELPYGIFTQIPVQALGLEIERPTSYNGHRTHYLLTDIAARQAFLKNYQARAADAGIDINIDAAALAKAPRTLPHNLRLFQTWVENSAHSEDEHVLAKNRVLPPRPTIDIFDLQ